MREKERKTLDSAIKLPRNYFHIHGYGYLIAKWHIVMNSLRLSCQATVGKSPFEAG